MIKVLVVDDQVLFRESLKFLIEQDLEIEVVGCAANGIEAEKLCSELQPDLVLMDIMMPVANGVEGTQLIKAKHPAVKIMILTTFDDEENVAQALKNGAEAYILKDVKPEVLVLAIKSLAKGMPVMHQKVLMAMLKQLNGDEGPPTVKFDLNRWKLSHRELNVIQLIVDGKTNKEIAACLNFTEGSVKNIITVVLDKLNLKDRTQLAVFAIKNHLV